MVFDCKLKRTVTILFNSDYNDDNKQGVLNIVTLSHKCNTLLRNHIDLTWEGLVLDDKLTNSEVYDIMESYVRCSSSLVAMAIVYISDADVVLRPFKLTEVDAMMSKEVVSIDKTIKRSL